ncbi:MAG: hypothetical protein GTN76_09270 [Candidatus Aenigmarchaeota archaeon]|nr:hypothetical protein [Candidatus Aenigmarchaeota archaeon]NIP40260.1 hypothetical protein [Candidatus Aenigmarchaeota archaeon]
MSEGIKVVDYCSSCKEYMILFRNYLGGVIKGDYNYWQGLRTCIENATGEINSIDEEILNALDPICKTCENGPGIYAMENKKWSELKKSCEEIGEKLDGMSSEEASKYLKENFSKMFLVSMLESLGGVLKKLYD